MFKKDGLDLSHEDICNTLITWSKNQETNKKVEIKIFQRILSSEMDVSGGETHLWH